MHAENKPFDLEELNLVRIMESLPDAILVVNTDSQVMYVNRKFCEEFGYHADEARNLVLEDFVPMDLRRKHAFKGSPTHLSSDIHTCHPS